MGDAGESGSLEFVTPLCAGRTSCRRGASHQRLRETLRLLTVMKLFSEPATRSDSVYVSVIYATRILK